MKIPENIKTNVEWIEKKHNIKISKFMLKVLSILSSVYSGLHHTEAESVWKAKEFTETRVIQYNSDYHRSLFSFDYSELTKLVLLAHKEGIRFGVSVNDDSTRRKRLIMTFSNRMGKRDGQMNQRHPTIKQAIKNLK